ncbi:hypothetical protein BJV82DRAFT_666864 [Fennellomyces sp. T-0311]|nr:hypothetical protein BJV82DRAFT_666864 [Fennellomyces sp. T-0311]
MPLQELPLGEQPTQDEDANQECQDQPMPDVDAEMTKRIGSMALGRAARPISTKKVKVSRQKRGTYNSYDAVKVKTALELVYVEKIGIPVAAAQSSIKQKALSGLLHDLVKNHGYPPVPKVFRPRKPKVRSARTDPDVHQFFDEIIRPQLQ